MKPGPNIFLIPFEAKDWDILYRWYYSGEYEEFFRDIDQAPNSEYFQRYAQLRNGFAFLVKTNEHFSQTVGAVVVYDVKAITSQAHFAMLIDRQFEHLGYGLEAIWLTMRHLFHDLGLQKMVIESVEGNEKIERYMEMYGVPREGVLLNEAKLEGKFYNVLRFGILRPQAEQIMKRIGDYYGGKSSDSGDHRRGFGIGKRGDRSGNGEKAPRPVQPGDSAASGAGADHGRILKSDLAAAEEQPHRQQVSGGW